MRYQTNIYALGGEPILPPILDRELERLHDPKLIAGFHFAVIAKADDFVDKDLDRGLLEAAFGSWCWAMIHCRSSWSRTRRG